MSAATGSLAIDNALPAKAEGIYRYILGLVQPMHIAHAILLILYQREVALVCLLYGSYAAVHATRAEGNYRIIAYQGCYLLPTLASQCCGVERDEVGGVHAYSLSMRLRITLLSASCTSM